MPKIVKSSEIEELSLEKQLEFYKDIFAGFHCESNGCDAPLHHDWVIYNGKNYCRDCFEWKWNNEKEKAEKEIEEMKRKIRDLQTEYEINQE